MTMPGFTAEAAGGPAQGRYGGMAIGTAGAVVVPQQVRLPAGCRVALGVDVGCFQRCRAIGGTPRACRTGCLREAVACGPSARVGA